MVATIDRYISDAEIETCAMHLLQRYGRQRRPVLEPPVPIEEMIDYTINVPLIWEAISDCDGMPVLAKLAVCGQPRPEIAIIVNEDRQLFFTQYEGVEQFSLAHEVGHYCSMLITQICIHFSFQMQRNDLLCFVALALPSVVIERNGKRIVSLHVF